MRTVNTRHLRPFLRGTGRLVATDVADVPPPPKPGERLTLPFTKPSEFPQWPATTWEAYTEDGKVWRWAESDNVVREDTAMEFGIPIDPAATAKASEADLDRTVANYRAAMAARTPDQVAEERAEARAAMGPGKTMVNVLTGETWTT